MAIGYIAGTHNLLTGVSTAPRFYPVEEVMMVKVKCWHCGGRGHIKIECSKCQGHGNFVVSGIKMTCDMCGGGGHHYLVCGICKGQGKVRP